MKKLLETFKNNKGLQVGLFALLFAIVGTILLLTSRAASTFNLYVIQTSASGSVNESGAAMVTSPTTPTHGKLVILAGVASSSTLSFYVDTTIDANGNLPTDTTKIHKIGTGSASPYGTYTSWDTTKAAGTYTILDGQHTITALITATKQRSNDFTVTVKNSAATTITAPPKDDPNRPDGDNPNTGVTDYTKLKACAGGLITKSGTQAAPNIIENCDFTGNVTIEAQWVTIRNSRFRGGDSNHAQLLLSDTGAVRADHFVGDHIDFMGQKSAKGCIFNWGVGNQIINSEITGCEDGADVGGGTFKGDWIHDLWVEGPKGCYGSGFDGSHNDGIQNQGGMVDALIIDNVNFELGAKVSDPYPGCPTQTWGPDKSVQLGGETNWGTPIMHNIVIQNSWLDARNTYWAGGGYASKSATTDTFTVRNNRWRIQTDSFGSYGTVSVGTTKMLHMSGNVWNETGKTNFGGYTISVTENQPIPDENTSP